VNARRLLLQQLPGDAGDLLLEEAHLLLDPGLLLAQARLESPALRLERGRLRRSCAISAALRAVPQEWRPLRPVGDRRARSSFCAFEHAALAVELGITGMAARSNRRAGLAASAPFTLELERRGIERVRGARWSRASARRSSSSLRCDRPASSGRLRGRLGAIGDGRAELAAAAASCSARRAARTVAKTDDGGEHRAARYDQEALQTRHCPAPPPRPVCRLYGCRGSPHEPSTSGGWNHRQRAGTVTRGQRQSREAEFDQGRPSQPRPRPPE